MPRAEGRPGPALRDPENLLIDYVLVGREWEVFKCSCCDQPFHGSGDAYDRDTGKMLTLHEYVDAQRDPKRNVDSGYGARVCDALRVRGGEDWEYKPGTWSGYACPPCADKINRHWIVMPGEVPDA